MVGAVLLSLPNVVFPYDSRRRWSFQQHEQLWFIFYDTDTWTTYKRDDRKLLALQMSNYGRLLSIKCRDEIYIGREYLATAADEQYNRLVKEAQDRFTREMVIACPNDFRHDRGIKWTSIWRHRGRRLWSVLPHAGIMDGPSTRPPPPLPLLQHDYSPFKEIFQDEGRRTICRLKSSLPGLPSLGHRSSHRTVQQRYCGPLRRDEKYCRMLRISTSPAPERSQIYQNVPRLWKWSLAGRWFATSRILSYFQMSSQPIAVNNLHKW